MAKKILSKQGLKIGHVKLSYAGSQRDNRYSEGAIEDRLLEIFKAPNTKQKRQAILNNNPAWEYIYHLSPQRGAVINWYPFSKGASILEVGAGCGAITEELVKQPAQITALELTEKRALVNAERNKNASNLEIIVGNLSDYKPNTKFDYVVCVGVLEYAGSFIDDNAPYDKFLQLLGDKLKPSGKLLLAIENRFGLKYWAGAREDHTGQFFDSLNQYPGKPVQTFGRNELEVLIKQNGFSQTAFYYPFPDYKHPRLIYSDDYCPGHGSDFPLHNLPTPVPGQSRVTLFSEALAMMAIEENGLFPHFSNSFIVVADHD